ncbi:RNA methyltransferase [Agarivorans sp. TSD2052]|uniref:RNA methyltransferase n=1 Tax=Agarivorans sp. TSD2052 TaxID=2937286 RepID=UPI00200D3A0C|nr:RNA methyltransferase [Agarivorans sp. TSD2052]UPW19703.1 RNA methyltransferase [Agarivorans sp. TSD2052]
MQQVSVQIGLVNPKSPSNVGSVMRAAGCFSAEAVFYTGQRYARAARFNTDTKNQSLNIPLSGVEDLTEQAAAGVKIVCIELAEGATPLPNFKHPQQALYIFGPEDGSISQALVDKADEVVYIPTKGCLNLAATVNVVLYDRLAKSEQVLGGDDLIRTSRDVNNRLKAK